MNFTNNQMMQHGQFAADL